MSLGQYTLLFRLGDTLFFRALIAQTILLGVLGLTVLSGKIYFDKSSNDKIISNTFRKWESEITESVYIKEVVSENEMPEIKNLENFQKELRTYGVVAKVVILPCRRKGDEISLFIGKKKLKSCVIIEQDHRHIVNMGLLGFFLILVSIGVSLIVWRKSRKSILHKFYQPLITAITEEVNKLQLSESERKKNEAVAKVATQVAHDIRSPLEVLRSLREEMTILPETTKKGIQLSINRIEEIALNLLKKEKKEWIPSIQDEDLLNLIQSILTEKNIEFRKFPEIKLLENFEKGAYGMFSKVDRVSFKSIISNIINNAAESLPERKGWIELKLFRSNDFYHLQIKDNGAGISEELGKKLFTKGITTKPGGNGLGLYNAKIDLEAVGGSLSFESQLGMGTTFNISLPIGVAPETFVEAIDVKKYEHIIVLDDDPSFHEVWSKRFKGLLHKIEHLYSVKELFLKYETLSSKILLLSDFDLLDQKMDGIDTIIKLNHSEHSILVTARSEDHSIQERCRLNKIKLLSKTMINDVQVINSFSDHGGPEGDSSKVVLIDDDKLIHFSWANQCKKEGIPFQGFKSVEDFLKTSQDFSKEVRIFIDSNLEDGIRGEIESERIFKLGFKNLYLATGYQKEDIDCPPWIKEVYSKRPDCLGFIK